MESTVKFSHAGLDGKVDLMGEGKVTVGKDGVSVQGTSSAAFSLSVRDIRWLKAGDYRIEIGTASGSLMLFNMGYRYEDVLREVHGARNETLISDSLVYESPKWQPVKAEVVLRDGGAVPSYEGRAEVRLYETALIIVPEMSTMVRFRYSDIGSVSSNDWILDIAEENGRKVSIRMLGKEHDPLQKAISEQVAEMKLRARSIIKTMHPGISEQELSQLSLMMREGKSAGLAELTFVAPDFLELLERRLETELPDSYRILMGKGRREMVRFGFKHGLMEGVTGDYIWFLIPIFSDDPAAPGNAIAFEASGSDSAKATYFFRIAGRSEYGGLLAQDRRKMAESVMGLTADALTEINFRREPIYLDESTLTDGMHDNYRYALLALPGLEDLRDRFIGRVSHVSAEKYSQDIDDLLRFNVSSRSDLERWKDPGTDGSG
ncbi:MAG TPA: hypothetical protein VGK23_10020 [Methanomassiliicoccales archaeon]|jgi:hypothetical protein